MSDVGVQSTQELKCCFQQQGSCRGDFHSTQEPSNFFKGSLGCGESNALQATAGECFEPLKGKREVRAAFGRHQSMDLVDDDGVDRAESVG